jgi:hypothetical protein
VSAGRGAFLDHRRGLTVTTNCARAVLRLVSVAVHVTFVRPTLKKLPEEGVQVTGRSPSTASAA